MNTVFSVNLVCKKELNLMLKVSETSSQGAMGFELRGTDYLTLHFTEFIINIFTIMLYL